MALDFGALAQGLTQGVTGYLAGRQQREQQDYQRQQEAERVRREEEQRAFQRLIQQHAMKLADQAEARAQQDQAVQLDQGGYSLYDPEKTGAAMQQAGNALGTPFGPMAGFLASYAQRQTTQPGQPIKTRRSVAEVRDQTERDRRVSDTMDERAFLERRDATNFSQQQQLQRERLGAERAMLTQRQAAAQQPAALQTLPAGVAEDISANVATLSGIDQALSLMKAPKADQGFGLVRGMQNAVGMANRMDPDNTALRAIVSNIGSMQIKLRSGAAVTASEWPRLRGFIPSVMDSPAEIRTKLQEIKRAISEETGVRAEYYRGQGYAVPGMGGAPSAAPRVGRDESTAAARFRAQAKADGYSDEEIDAELRRRGIK